MGPRFLGHPIFDWFEYAAAACEPALLDASVDADTAGWSDRGLGHECTLL